MSSLKAPALSVYLLFCIGISAFALGSFAQIIQEYLTVEYDYRMEALIVTGQVGFQWLFMRNASWSERKEYMVIALTVSAIGSSLLLPLIISAYIFSVSAVVATGYFFLVVGVIFVTHHVLIKKMKLPSMLTLTWVLYRVLLLVYVIFPREDRLYV